MTENHPNLLYIGTSKAGSTWIYDVLNRHPDVFMAPGKGLYFFSRHFERGLDWYASHFVGATQERVVGEVSHAYLYDEEACRRIADTLSDVRLLVCVRDPADRAFSEYLDARKNGKLEMSFEEALTEEPELIERGCYARYISLYLDHFPRERVLVVVFDDLADDPDGFAANLFDFLGVERRPLTAAQRQRMLPAGVPRSRRLTRAAKRVAHLLHRLGLRGLRGRLKTSRRVRDTLYRPLGDDERPRMDPETRARLKRHFQPEVEALDALLGTSLAERWGYTP